MAISAFNKGALSAVMERLWLENTVVTINAIRDKDDQRIAKADAVTPAGSKHKRKCSDTAKKVKIHQQQIQ